MSQYQAPRVVASVITGIGWLFAAGALFLAVLRVVRSDIAYAATAVPFVFLVAVGLALVLLGWMARAVFDIAERAP